MVAGSPTALSRKKIAVIEDDPDTREIELLLLADQGYDTVGVADGEHAAETVAREHADLVILDLMLPGKDGLQVIAELGRQPDTAQTPILIVSAYVNQLGARNVLHTAPQVKRILDKPFDVTELLDAVAHETRRDELKQAE